MKFLYNKEASKDIITIDGDSYKYLFKVRRIKVGSLVELRNMQDDMLYIYKVVSVNRKSATLEIVTKELSIVESKRSLTIGWCIIDPKIVDKSIASLNEIGVERVVFIKCAYSQANFKIKKDRLEKILINSSQQCGRSSLMRIDFANSINDFLRENPNSYLLDFSKRYIDESADGIESIVVGCEGGISKDERALFKDETIVGFNTPLILRSESAAIGIATKILI